MSYKNNYYGNSELSQDLNIIFGKKTVVANTYAEEDVKMPTVNNGLNPAVVGIEVEMEQGKYLDAVGDYLGWQLANSEQDDLEDISNPNILAKDIIESKGIGLEPQKLVLYKELPYPLKVSQTGLKMGLKGTHTQTIKYRIYWVPRKSAVPQRDTIQANQQF